MNTEVDKLLTVAQRTLAALSPTTSELEMLVSGFKDAVIAQWNIIQYGYAATKENPVPEYVLEGIGLYYFWKLLRAHNNIQGGLGAHYHGASGIDFIMYQALLLASKDAIVVTAPLMLVRDPVTTNNIQHYFSEMSRMGNYNTPNCTPWNWGTAIKMAPFLYAVKLASRGEYLTTGIHSQILADPDCKENLLRFGITVADQSRIKDSLFS